MLQNFLLSMAETTITMSVLILLLLLFTRLFGARYTAGCRYILWIVVILRLCFPVSPPFVPALLEIPVPAGQMQTEKPPAAEMDGSVFPAQTEPAGNGEPVPPSMDIPSFTPDNAPQYDTESSDIRDDTAGMERQPVRNLWLLPVLLWASVAVLLFFVRFLGYLSVSGRLRKNLLPPTAMQTDLCIRLGIRQGLREKNIPELYISGEINSPMLCGFRKPIILLPDIPLTDNQLTGVLAHELTHRRRNDLWVKLACMLAASLHWFNPLVYIAAGRCSREMELSCDEVVLAGMDEAVRMAYGKVMLDIIKRCSNPTSSLTTHFNPRRSAVRERFEGILDGSRKKKGVWPVAAMLFLCLTAGSLVTFGQAEPQMEYPEMQNVPPAAESAEALSGEPEIYPITLTAGETYDSFGRTVGWFEPVTYGTMDMTVLQNGTLPFPANSTDPQETLYYYNQISYLSEYTKVFAVTGALYAEGDPAYAYVFSCGSDGIWNVTELGTEDEGTDCKGIVLLGVPQDEGTGWLLGMLHDNGSVRFFESADGQTWRCSGTFLCPDYPNGWLVQFSRHSGIGGETLCLVFDSPAWEEEQIWLSFDWGQSFTRYEIPILETLPGEYEDVTYLYKSGGGGSGEFCLYFQVDSARNSRYVCYRSAHGSTEGSLTFCDRNIAGEALVQYRYSMPGDRGNVSYAGS